MGAAGVILSIGGGGFTHDTDPALDDFCLRFAPASPRLGYLGWANEDDETRIARFYRRFDGRAALATHLPFAASALQLAQWIAGLDLVYLGGGHTGRLIRHIADNQTRDVFQQANQAGCVLAGVSAGGVCWYDWALSDSGGKGYAPLLGLGLMRGGICPHYSSEPDRAAPLATALHNGAAGPAHAVDDGVCLVARQGTIEGSFSARPGQHAYCLQLQGDAVTTRQVDAFV